MPILFMPDEVGIFVRQNGAWVLADNVNIYAPPATGAGGIYSHRRVLAAYLYQTDLAVPPPVGTTARTADRHLLFDYSTPRPAVTNLVGTSPAPDDPNEHVRATVSWDAMPDAVSYQLTRTTYPAPYMSNGRMVYVPPIIVSATIPATSTPSYVFTGLTPDTPYQFTVAYTDDFGISSVDNTIYLDTGHALVTAHNTNYPANPPAGEWASIRPSSSDTWTAANHWDPVHQVTQGYLNSSAYRAYGCINYYNGYGNLAASLESRYSGTYGVGIGKAIVDHLGGAAGENATIVDADFSLVNEIEGCSAGENVVIYPAHFSYQSTTAAPTSAGASTYFDAPGPGLSKTNFRLADNSKLILWATNLAMKVQPHNGLMVYRSDTVNTPGAGYAGYCMLRGLDHPSATDRDWLIDVWIKFSFTLTPYVAPVWS